MVRVATYYSLEAVFGFCYRLCDEKVIQEVHDRAQNFNDIQINLQKYTKNQHGKNMPVEAVLDFIFSRPFLLKEIEDSTKSKGPKVQGRHQGPAAHSGRPSPMSAMARAPNPDEVWRSHTETFL
jgi:hypothetical protein